MFQQRKIVTNLCVVLLWLPVSLWAQMDLPQQGEVDLSAKDLVHHIVQQNAKVLYAKLQQDIAEQGVRYEEGVYATEFFTYLNHDDQRVSTTASDRLSSVQRFNQHIFDEENTNLELGVRRTFETGTEIKVSYAGQEKTNNVIPLSDANEDTEYTEKLAIVLKQPLLKGLNNPQTESKIAKADLQHRIAKLKYQQELMRASSEALNAYWQLYKVAEVLAIREKALDNAQKSYDDVQQRVTLGRLSEMNVLEAKSNILKRRSELHVAQLAYENVQSQLKTLINLPSTQYGELTFSVADLPNVNKTGLDSSFEEYFEWVLSQWPSYAIAEKKQAIQAQEVLAAKDEKKPALDLEMGITSNELHNDFGGGDLLAFQYLSWFVGLNFSLFLDGNERGIAKERMAAFRYNQALSDKEAVKVGLSNDLKAKLYQVESAYLELLSIQDNVDTLKEMYDSERKQFKLGGGKLMDLYEREDRLNIARQRYVEGVVKYEKAKVALSLADGSLLKKHDIDLTVSTTRSEE